MLSPPSNSHRDQESWILSVPLLLNHQKSHPREWTAEGRGQLVKKRGLQRSLLHPNAKSLIHLF